MLIKVRKLGATFTSPQVEEKEGLLCLKAEMIGELVKLPPELVEAGELVVGELTMGFFPVGIEVKLDQDGPLNGLWVQREIFDALSQARAVAA